MPFTLSGFDNDFDWNSIEFDKRAPDYVTSLAMAEQASEWAHKHRIHISINR